MSNKKSSAKIVAGPNSQVLGSIKLDNERRSRSRERLLNAQEKFFSPSPAPTSPRLTADEERIQQKLDAGQKLSHKERQILAEKAAAVRRPKKKKPGLTPAQQAAKKAARAEESRQLRDSMRMVRCESPLTNQAARAKKK